PKHAQRLASAHVSALSLAARRRWVLTDAQRQAAYAHFGRKRAQKQKDGESASLPSLAASNGARRNGFGPPNGNGGGNGGWAPPASDDDLPPRIRRRRLRRRQQASRLPHRLALGLLTFPLVVIGAVAVAAAFGGQAAVKSTCSLNALRPLHIGENSFVFASDGSLLGSIPSSRNRQPLQLGQMTRWMPKATVAI